MASMNSGDDGLELRRERAHDSALLMHQNLRERGGVWGGGYEQPCAALPDAMHYV